MEQYNNDFDGEIKEKSIYLVHLDNTRIVILVSVFVGIIALSFLIGMNFAAPSDSLFSDSTQQKQLLNSQIESQDADDIDSLLSKETSHDSLDSLDAIDDELMKENNIIAPDTAENIVPDKPVQPKQADPKPVKKEAPKKKEVVAASVKKDTKTHVERKRIQRSEKKGFSIQIASFDTRSKAVQESDTINKMNFDSYIASASVNGKQFYRVKIGPFSNKTEAFATLDNLHSTTRYKDSYITFEK
ncbi:MAG: SPOR domain-containing protein [Spirochaetota bacterium]